MLNRDINVLNHIHTNLNIGRVIPVPNTEYSMYIASTQWEMLIIVNLINGMIRLKVPSYKFACEFLGIKFIEANYRLKPFSTFASRRLDQAHKYATFRRRARKSASRIWKLAIASFQILAHKFI